MSDELAVGPSMDQVIFAVMGYTQWLDYRTWREGESDGRGFSALGLPRVSTDPGAAFTWVVAWLQLQGALHVGLEWFEGEQWRFEIDEPIIDPPLMGVGASPAEAVARCALAWAAARDVVKEEQSNG